MGGKAWQAGSWGQDTVLAGTFGVLLDICKLVSIVVLFFFTTKLVKVSEESLTV